MNIEANLSLVKDEEKLEDTSVKLTEVLFLY